MVVGNLDVRWRQLRCELKVKVFGSFGGSYRVAWPSSRSREHFILQVAGRGGFL